MEAVTATAGYPEVVVSLPDTALNDPETAGGARSVSLECLRPDGRVEFRVEHFFPFADTDDGTQPPHVHQAVSPQQLDVIESCRLEGTTVELQGALQQADAAP